MSRPLPHRRPRGLAVLAAVLLGLAPGLPWPAASAWAWARPGTVLDLPLPPGSRRHDTHLFASGRGFRATVDFYQRFLDRHGLAHRAIPLYRYRGTAVARFLSQQPGTHWAAIHVFHEQARTMVFIVPRPS